MIVTVFWEDQRGVPSKGFGPHELLVSCVADHANVERRIIEKRVNSIPTKGNGNLLKALRGDLSKLTNSGSVAAVFDWDKLRELLKRPGATTPYCKSGLASLIRKDVPGERTFYLVFLEQNMESLLDLVAIEPAGSKPTPDRRDRILAKAAWSPALRRKVRDGSPSFERLVLGVSKLLGIDLVL